MKRHRKYIIRFLVAIFAFIVCALCIKSNKLPLSVIGIIFYFIGANFFTESITAGLQVYIVKEWKPQKLTATLGNIDRLLYATCIVLGKEYYQYIGIWLGIKIVSRILEKPSTNFVEEGERKNTYLIGNIVSLAFGIYAGVLIKKIFAL